MSGSGTGHDGAMSRGVTHVDASAHAVLRSVPIGAVALHDGFWRDRVEANRTVGIPRLLERLEEHGVVDNFRRRKGLDVERRGFWFTDSDLYKWMEAAAWTLASGPDNALATRLDELVELVEGAQTPEGYVNTNFDATQRFGGLDWSHELYCGGHLLQAAIAHHRATGDSRLLEVAVRFAELLCVELGGAARPVTDAHPGVELALVELARETGEDRYRDLAATLVSRVDFAPGGELWGHAVRAAYFACGVADLATDIDAPPLRDQVSALWASMIERKSYVTGGLGGRWVGESVGRAYELPNEGSYSETCAGIASAMWAWRMLTLTGDAAMADHLELALHNAFLAGVSLAGDEWFYANPLAFAGEREHDPWDTDRAAEQIAGPFPLRRRPWRDVTCCPPNAARMFASFPGYLYGTVGDDLWVHLYASSAVRHAGWRVTQRSELPWQGRIELTVHDAPAGVHAVALRIPRWTTAAAIIIDGKEGSPQPAPAIPTTQRVATPGTYCVVRRAWAPGDRIVLELSVAPEFVVCNPRVAENRGSVAIRRGPFVYCCEGVDNDGIDVLEAAVRVEELRDEPRAGLLDGLVAVRAAGSVPTDAWGPLYRMFSGAARAEHGVDLCAIPYFAWANRGCSPMTVWLRRA